MLDDAIDARRHGVGGGIEAGDIGACHRENQVFVGHQVLVGLVGAQDIGDGVLRRAAGGFLCFEIGDHRPAQFIDPPPCRLVARVLEHDRRPLPRDQHVQDGEDREADILDVIERRRSRQHHAQLFDDEILHRLDDRNGGADPPAPAERVFGDRHQRVVLPCHCFAGETVAHQGAQPDMAFPIGPRQRFGGAIFLDQPFPEFLRPHRIAALAGGQEHCRFGPGDDNACPAEHLDPVNRAMDAIGAHEERRRVPGHFQRVADPRQAGDDRNCPRRRCPGRIGRHFIGGIGFEHAGHQRVLQGASICSMNIAASGG